MNIIKLKDVIKPGDDLFNEHLKGRYAYWVQMRYIVSFDHMNYVGYVACEMDINKLLQKEDGTYPEPFGCPYIDTSMGEDCDIYPYIDSKETDIINSISELIIKNNYVTDSDITIDELKKFRTWLATQLLSFDENNQHLFLFNMYDEDTTHMLTYYKQGMYDDTISNLINMSVYKGNIQPQTCNCCNTIQTTSYINNISVCNPISEYRKYIYNKMVLTFSEIEFWTQFPAEFILEVKKYIDNIIRLNFTLYNNENCSNVESCNCLHDYDSIQAKYVNILEHLSESMQFIANKETVGHKNFITDSLNNWASLLYENMEW